MKIPTRPPSPDLSPEFAPSVVTTARRIAWVLIIGLSLGLTVAEVLWGNNPAGAAVLGATVGWSAQSYVRAVRADRVERAKSVTVLVSLDLPDDRRIAYDQAVLAEGAEWESLPLALPDRSAVRVTVQKITPGGP